MKYVNLKLRINSYFETDTFQIKKHHMYDKCRALLLHWIYSIKNV
jgi:hypothetical protein